jgi:hypothetical protein
LATPKRTWVIRGVFAVAVLGILHFLAYEAGMTSGDEDVVAKLQKQAPPPPPPAPVPVNDPQQPAYPGAELPEIVAERISVQGSPAEVTQFTTRDKVDDVISHYKKLFTDKGFLVATGTYYGGAQWVSYSKPEDRPFRMVTAMPFGKETLVLFSATDPRAILAAAANMPTDAPMPEGAGNFMTIETGGAGFRQRTVYFQFKAGPATPKDLAVDYADRLRAAGWRAKTPLKNEGGETKFVFELGPRGLLGSFKYNTQAGVVGGAVTLMDPEKAQPKRNAP